MICKIILLGLAGLTLAGEPDVFQNYFDDTIKEVDIPLDAAIKACLQNGNTFADKVKNAYAECFGSADYDFGDLAAKEGSKDSDNDGLPDSFENNEQCFYKKMGWVNGAGALNPDAIKGDLAGLESGTKSEFDGNIDKCAGWNGDFGSRRKREAGETETEEEASNVPSVMESGSSALGWLKAAVRKTRSAEPGNGDKKRKAQRKRKRGGKKVGKNGPKRGSRKNGNPKKGKGGKGSKGGKKKRKGRKGGKTSRRRKRKRKGGKGSKKATAGKKKRKGGKNRKRKGGKAGKRRRSGRKNNKGGNRSKKNNKNSKRKGKKGKNGGNGARRKAGRNNKGSRNAKKNKGKPNKENENKKARNNVMTDSTYNQLWCFDLSLEQVLEKCVENKIKN